MLVNAKTLFLAAAFLSGSVFAAGAQTGSSSSSSGSGVSAATHCMDQATGQPRLKTASSGNLGSGSGSTSGSASGSASGATGSGSGMGSSGGMSGGASAATRLPNC
jgi:hypothetical protein